MDVAITGATGFIGRALVLQHLAAGDTVRALSRRPCNLTGFPDAVKVYSGDLVSQGNSALLSRFVDGADVVYHCAGEIAHASRMRLLHVDGTDKLAEAASGNIGHWVQLSSVGAYGPVSSGVVTEETALNPVGPYECTKVQSDLLVQRYADAGAFSYTVLRPANVFGPNMTNQSLFQLIRTIERRLFFFIGKPGASANYIPVDNVVDALVRCGTTAQARGRVYNLSDYRRVEDVVATIAAALGVPPPRIRIPEAPIRRIARLLGRVPRFPLAESRVDALVARAVYSTGRIEREIQYAQRISVEAALCDLVRSRKC